MKDLVKVLYSKPTLINAAEAVVEIYGSSLVGGIPARDNGWHERPRLAGDVRLEFGGTYHCPRTGTPTPMYVLVIKPELYDFCSGWNKYQKAHVGLEKGFGPAVIFEERYAGDLYVLLQNWSSLKTKIEQIIADQDAANAFINNFEI